MRFQPAANASGNAYASLTFRVRDDGGTADGGINLDASPNTLTFNVQAVNSAPTAVADAVTVGEAGGVNNTTDPTPSVSGNVLTSDTDSDPGDTKTVTAVIGMNTGTVGSAVAGRYGSLVLNANGSYTYTVDNNNPAVQALRLVTDTLTDVFTYTMADGGGLSSSTTLSITITGANDFPVARDDDDAVKEAATATAGVWGSTTGTVIPNDSDVDGGALVVESVSSPTNVSNVLSVTSPIASATVTALDAGGTNWNANGGINDNAASPQTVLRNGQAVNRSDGAGVLTVYRTGTGANSRLVFNHPLSLYDYATGSTGTVFGVSGSNSLFRIDTITPTVSSSTVLSVTAGTIASIQVGHTVSGTDIPAGITVTQVNVGAETITLSQAVAITNRQITFTGSGGATTSQNIAPGSSTTLTGLYGNLILSANGNYTYNLTNNSLNDGQSATETFTYTLNDSAGGTDTAVLSIRIDGRSAVAITASDDQYNTNEGNTLDTNSANGVLANDAGSSTVTSYTWGDQSTTIGSAVSYPDVGTLTLRGDGSFRFEPAGNFNGTVPAIVYTISSGAAQASAVLTITVNPVNDGPTAVADTTEAREAGGYNNAVPGQNPTGNLLHNDTDPERDVLTVTAVSHSSGAGTVGQARAGTYGSLTLNNDGSYSYAVSNSSALVQALAAGQTVTDVFNYTVSDGSATSSSTLTVTVRGANDAPENTVPANAVNANMGTSTAIGGVSVADVDDANLTVTLSVASGTLSLGTTTGLSFSSGSNGQAAMTFSGSKANLNNALATLSYTPGASFVSADTLSIQTVDSAGLQDNDTVAIAIVDNRALTVTGTTVNEASPYVLFQVSGATGQSATLSLGNTTSTGDVDATQGRDFLPNLQYFDGTSWLNYTGAPVPLPAGNVLLVRAPVLQDSNFEGPETLTLTATNRAGTASTPGTSTIVDNGTGSIFLGNNNTFTPNNVGDTDPQGPDYPGYLDDDRPVTVSSIVVNEASPYAVFTVTGAAGQKLQLSMTNGTALVGTDTASATSFEVHNGSGWVSYTAGTDLTLAGTTLQVRLALTQDNTFEQGETFFLGVTQMGSGLTAYGKATILDDGNGSRFVFDNDSDPTNDPQNPVETTGPGVGFDDDRPLSVVAFGPVNEASTHAMFTVTAADGYQLDLAVQAPSSGAAAAFAGFNSIQWSLDGTTWTTYSSQDKPTVPASNKVYVRVDITSETDNLFEGTERFALKANYATNTAKSAAADTSIVDDGTGKKYGPNMPGGLPAESTDSLDDDRDPSVNSVTVNEGSAWAVFEVRTTTGCQITGFNLGAGATNLTRVDNQSIQYWAGNGPWQDTTVSGMSVNLTAGEKILVRVNIISERDNNLEGPEAFQLQVITTAGTVNGTGTIVDDGTGTKFPDQAPGAGPAPATDNTNLDDDRALAVNSITVNEGSPFAVFTVTAQVGQTMTLALGNGTVNPSAGPGDGNPANGTEDYGTALQYWDPNSGPSGAWLAYPAGGLTVPGSGTGSTAVLVRMAIHPDAVFEGAEDFKLTATYTSGVSRSAVGTATIKDDGTGTKFPDQAPGAGPAPATDNTNLDDDRGITVSGLDDVSEGSNAIFTVTLPDGNTRNTEISLALSHGTGASDAEANDYSSSFTAYYGSGNNVQPLPIVNGKVTLPAGVSTFYVKVPTTQDTDFEGAESFSLTATITGGKTGSDTSTILDNGAGRVYNDQGQSPAGPGNDDRPLNVTGYGPVNEGSTYAMFSISAAPGQTLDLSLEGTAAAGDREADHAAFTLIEYSYDGINWTPYSNSQKPLVPAGGQVYVRVNITSEADSNPEGAEGFALRAAYTSNTARSATAETTIVDDGTGKKYGPNMPSGTPAESTTGLDNDTRVPVPPPPPVQPPAPAPQPVVTLPPAPPPPARPAQVFGSALNPLEARRAEVPVAMPVAIIGDVRTSNSGFPIVVDANRPAGLQVFRGITDQFVSGTTVAKVSLPADAFVHSKTDAVVQLAATQADGSPLPPWIRFDANTGSFEVDPTQGGVKGRLDVKVVARDNEGREATAIFRVFVGERPANTGPNDRPGADRPQGRSSLSDQLRQAAQAKLLLDLTAPVQPELPQAAEPLPQEAAGERSMALSDAQAVAMH